jgi:glycerol kinase
MSKPALLLAIDQGTTSSRAMIFDDAGKVRARAQAELPQIYPEPGWVEHDPDIIWRDCVACVRQAMTQAGKAARDIAALGITNQRETVVVWERATGRPVRRAIVWQDRRTAPLCERLRRDGAEPMVRAKTGLLLDPYFSASKLAWILDQDGLRARAERGELLAGTIECFLLWRLTGGTAHATDASNAARTMLFDIHRQDWDDDLLRLFDIPRVLLPEVRDCSGAFGSSDAALFGGAIAVGGMAGDQQAAAFGQTALRPGMVKATYGTGCFVLANTGDKPAVSGHRLLTTVAWRLNGQVTYALEGSIFIAGAAVQWLRDSLKVIKAAGETELLARSVPGTGGVYLVPAFVGLGAPHWDAEARGAIVGLTRASGVAELARAALESIAYQSADLLAAIKADGLVPASLRVDGGLAVNNWAMQFLADILGVPVERPEVTETTALGAAYLAGLHAGVFPGHAALESHWRSERRFEPAMEPARRDELLDGWRRAVARVRSA